MLDYKLHDAYISLFLWVNIGMHIFELSNDLLQGKITQDEESWKKRKLESKHKIYNNSDDEDNHHEP